MTEEIFDQQLMRSNCRLEEPWQRADQLQKPPKELWQQNGQCPEKQQELLRVPLEELSCSLEESSETPTENGQTPPRLISPDVVPLGECPPTSSGTANLSSATDEPLFRAMFESAANGIALLDSQGRVIKSNPALQKMLGYSEQELQRVFPALMNLDKAGIESVLFQELIAGQRRSYQLEKRFLAQDQPVKWGRLTVSLVHGPNAEPTFATCLLEEITELRQLEEAQRQGLQHLEVSRQEQTPPSKELVEIPSQQMAVAAEQAGRLLNDILCASAECFLVCDRAGKYIYANQTAAQVVGFAQSDLIGKTWRQLGLPAEIMERFDTQREAVFRTGEPLTDETSFPTVNGVRDYEYTIQPISEINSDPGAVIVSVKDITKHKQAAVAANAALEKEQEMSALKSHSAFVVSQELRTLLHNILAYAELMGIDSQQGNNEKKHNYFQRIQVNVRRINQLLDDLLWIGKVQTTEQQLNLALLDLTKFCRELIEELEQGAGFKHSLTFSSQGEYSSVCMDQKLLRQILMNLMLNAIKFSPKGSEVKLDVVCHEKYAIFRIQDFGIGIPQKDQELIFKAFHQGSNGRTVLGKGLGLAIVKECVDLQGGEIAVESEVGVGTIFTVKLPLNLRQVRKKNVKGS